MRVLLFAFAGLIAAVTSATTSPSTTLQPASPWDLDYAQNNCRLIRLFGAGKDTIKLVFEQLTPRGPITVLLLGKLDAGSSNNVLAFESLPGVQISGGQRLDAVGSSDKVAFWPRRLGRGRWGLITEDELARERKATPLGAAESNSAPPNLTPPRINWRDREWRVEPLDEWQAEDAAFSARAAQVTGVIVNPGRARSILLHTGPLAKPFQALEQCASDSLKDWGIDPGVQSTIVTGAHPVEDPQRLFSASDYPQAALRSFKEDNLEVWLNIDAQGGISGCRVISDFASPEINNAMCAMVRGKEKFVPARTKDGRPVADFYTQNFVFKIR